jgi:hypothetical protein
MRKVINLAAVVCGIAASGCIDTDAAVFVEASIAAPSAAVSGSTLGTSLDGSFALNLHLGPRASGAGEVSWEAFTMTNADQSVEVIALEVVADRAQPVTVEPDSDVGVAFSFSTGANPLPVAKKDELCAAGGLRIKAVIRDSLQGVTPTVSDVFQPSCM